MQEDSNLTFEYQFLKAIGDPEDLSQAAEILVRWRKPDREIMDKTLTSGQLVFHTNGTDGIVKYTFTVTEAIDGEWDVQGRVTFAGSVFWSSIRTFYLNANLPSS